MPHPRPSELTSEYAMELSSLGAPLQKKEENGKVISNKHRIQEGTYQWHSLMTTLKVCAKQKDLHRGLILHDHIIAMGLLQNDVMIGSSLVNMLAKCGSLAKAQEVFDKLPFRNIVSWNALIAGYTQHGHPQHGLDLCERMQSEGFCPDAVTFVCILKACTSLAAVEKGEDTHAQIIKYGLLEKDVLIGNALVDMYAKCGPLAKAHEAFDKLVIRDIVSWNVLIAGYAQHGCGNQVFDLFEQMHFEGLSPDAITFISMLKTCGSTGDVMKGQEIHAKIVREGLLEQHIVAGNALVYMYAKCGLLGKAEAAFDKLPARDVILWNSLITGYTQHAHGEDALNCYEQMQLEGISPSAVTFICVLKACGSIGALYKGQDIHAEIDKDGLFGRNNAIGNALVDMYAKCGLHKKAAEVFDNLPIHDIVSWNALITGFAVLGKADDAFLSFDKMIEEGLLPDSVTFTSVLNACSHTGLLDKGQAYFETMSACYEILPSLEHHSCMLDLFGRAGLIDKAVALIKGMPCYADLTMWHTMLGACLKWGNMKTGRQAFEHAVHLDARDDGAYICMSNMAGQRERVLKL